MEQGKKENLLTVNVVTYNHSKYVGKCLDTILSQKTNFDFIIRVFDDLSTDGTDKIVEEYKQKYPEKIFFTPLEKKIGVAQNCLRAYQGIETKYYMYIEGDDYLCDDDKFQMQIDILENNPTLSVCSHNTYMINLGDNCFKTKEQPYLIGISEGIYTFEDFKNFKWFDPHLSSRIARTDCIDHEAGEVFLFDWNNIFLLLKKGNMYYIDRIMSVYNQTGEGIYSGASINKKFENEVREFYKYDKYTNSEDTKMLHFMLIQFIQYLYAQNERVMWTPKKRNIIKEIKHYIIPRFILDILDLPKNISRRIRQQAKPKYYFLAPVIIDFLNLPRDIIRKIKKQIKSKNSDKLTEDDKN